VNLAREWYRPHFERIYQHFHMRIGDLDQLELISGQYPSRERFLTEVTLDPPQARADEDHLTLSTIHAAKGMEWDAVYVLNVADGSLPSEFGMTRPEVLEEERRLLYVAMMRAQNDLMLVSPGKSSRFMTEKVVKAFESRNFQGTSLGEGALRDAAQATVDASARLKQMW
jgi:DNA helicase-2/ATP-dependent DNA helicase PcrA